MRRFVGYLFGFVVLLPLLVGCSGGGGGEDGGQPPTPRAGVQVPIFREFRGQQAPFPDRAFLVIQDATAWQSMWGSITPPQVDFTQFTVLAAMLGQRPSGGYDIMITEVRATETQVTAYVQETRPATDVPVAQVLTYPYHMVVVPKIATPVSFVLEGAPTMPLVVIQNQFTGTQARGTTAQTAVLRDEGAWRAFWVESISTSAAIPSIDFTRYMAVAVLIGQRPTGGYTVRITSIAQENEQMIVRYRIREPQPGEVVTQALTSPYAIAIVPRSILPVIFRNAATPLPVTTP